MEALLSARAALVQALFEGPGYGVALAQCVKDRTSGHVRLGHGNIYTALRALEQDGLVWSWKVVPRGRRGARARLYYELTPRGIEVAEAQRQGLAGLVTPKAPAPSDGAVALMRTRLQDCSDLSASVLALRDVVREARR
jgi:DNA-binding PadR family transcriptional regulator